jgi:LysR family hydrogen peroxide-inducible transcriptional activator
MAGVERGNVVVGSIPTVAPCFLPRRLVSFGRKFPEIRVRVIEELTAELLERVQDGTVDLALLVLPVAGGPFVCQELLREPLYLVVPENYRLASQPGVHLKQIERDSFLLLNEDQCFRENTLSACRRARLELNVIFERGQFATILAMPAAGAGLSVVPQMAVEPRKGCRFIPIADQRAYRRIGIVELKQHFRSRAHRAFLKHLQERAATG